MPDDTCTVEDCEGKRLARGMCAKHYQRWKKNGTTDGGRPPKMTPEERREAMKGWKRRYREANREQVNAERQAHREQNLERERARCREYNRRHGPRLRAYNKGYRAANPDKVSAANREWYARHPDWARAKGAARRARERQTAVGPVDYEAILDEHGMVCHICLRPILSRDDLHFDHVRPISRGGTHTAGNIRPACAKCNRGKGARCITWAVLRYRAA